MPALLKDADIRPISDLRNRFAEVSDYVQGGKTIIFTKNGYGCIRNQEENTHRVVAALAAIDTWDFASLLRMASAICVPIGFLFRS